MRVGAFGLVLLAVGSCTAPEPSERDAPAVRAGPARAPQAAAPPPPRFGAPAPPRVSEPTTRRVEPTAQDPPRSGHLLIDGVQEGSGFRVVRARRVDGALPRHRGGLRGLAWRYRVLGVDGLVLFEGELPDPGALRGEFRGSDPGRIEAVHLRRQPPLHFAIRVPELAAGRIEFFQHRGDGDLSPLGGMPFPAVR